MLRFLKKPWKSSKKPVPPGNTAHQITAISAEHGRDSQGEHRSRKILELMRLMALIRLWYQVPTTQSVPGSQIKTGGLTTSGFLRRMPQFWFLDWMVVMRQVSVVGCSHWGQRLFPIR